MKEIQLTKGQVALVDDEDYERINKYKWRAKLDKKSKSYYAARTINYYNKFNKRTARTIFMAREIMNLTSNDKLHVDHKNHDTLNNQKDNLRLATNNQNQYNKLKLKNKTSIYKGVSWNKKDKKWKTSIGFNGKRIHLGYFKPTPEGEILAAKTYDKKAVELFGEFALLNFPKENYI